MKQPLRILYVGSCNSSNLAFTHRLSTLNDIDVFQWITSGERSVNEYSQFLPDVVFVDVLTDDISGIETTRWLREQNNHLKIVLVSIAPVMAFLDVSRSLELNGYLPKSILTNDLQKSLITLQLTGNAYNYILSTAVFASWLSELKGAQQRSIGNTRKKDFGKFIYV